MKWLIPAKTFLVGEYIAMQGGPAILLTTTPCFELTLTQDVSTYLPFHPDSPAGQFWRKKGHDRQLIWHNPYQLGGLGASSAEFVGAYWAHHYLTQGADSQSLLDAYTTYAGSTPSGYDVLAQTHEGCVLIHRIADQISSRTWNFADLDFILVHTGQKLATHEHLKNIQLTRDLTQLTACALLAHEAFIKDDEQRLIDAVHAYHAILLEKNLVAPHSQKMLRNISNLIAPLAAKGCGAMGADVLLFLVEKSRLPQSCSQLTQAGYAVLATGNNLYCME